MLGVMLTAVFPERLQLQLQVVANDPIILRFSEMSSIHMHKTLQHCEWRFLSILYQLFDLQVHLLAPLAKEGFFNFQLEWLGVSATLVNNW